MPCFYHDVWYHVMLLSHAARFNIKHDVQRDTERPRANTERGRGGQAEGEEGPHAGHLNAKAEGSDIIITPSSWWRCLLTNHSYPESIEPPPARPHITSCPRDTRWMKRENITVILKYGEFNSKTKLFQQWKSTKSPSPIPRLIFWCLPLYSPFRVLKKRKWRIFFFP